MAKYSEYKDFRQIYKELKAEEPDNSYEYTKNSDSTEVSKPDEVSRPDDVSESFRAEPKQTDSKYSNRVTNEYNAPNSRPGKYLTRSTSKISFRKYLVNYVIFPISVLSLIWVAFGYADGTGKYSKDYKSRSVKEAIELFRHGQYVNSSECFHRVYKNLSVEERDFRIVADEMAWNCRRGFRIFFKFPTAFKIPSSKSDSYRLPEFVKEEMYKVASVQFANYGSLDDDSGVSLDKAVSFYRMLGNYRDSEEKYKVCIKQYILRLLKYKNYNEARSVFYTLKDKELITYFEKLVYKDKYELAKQNLQDGNFVPARKMLRELAKNNVEDSREILESLKKDIIFRTGIHINQDLTDKKKHRVSYYSENKNIIKAQQDASDYLEEQYGLQWSEMSAFCKERVRELADKEFEKGDYLAAYNDYSLIRKKLPGEEIVSEPRIMECLDMLVFAPRKIGSVVVLGRYEQDGNLENGPEPIEWVIVAISENKALLLSKYVLDMRRMSSENKAVQWDTSDLRKWLNESFYNKAFNEEEKELLQKIEISLSGFTNRSFHEVDEYENQFLHSLLGDKNYKPSKSVMDYVICPDSDDLKTLVENLDTVAYSTPYATAVNNNAYKSKEKSSMRTVNAVKDGNATDSKSRVASETGIASGTAKKGFMNKLFSNAFFGKSARKHANGDNASETANLREPRMTDTPKWANIKTAPRRNSDLADSENASDTRVLEDWAKYYDSCGYWLRNRTTLVGNTTTYFACYDVVGKKDSTRATKLMGVRPEIMILLSDEEALPREKSRFEVLENKFLGVEKLKKFTENFDAEGIK